MRFSDFWEKFCNAEIVIAWTRAQFSSCRDPMDATGAILCSYSHFWGVSHSGCIRVHLGNFEKLDPLWTIGVTRLMGCLAVGVADRGVSAGWALLANWESAWVLLVLVGVCTDCTVGIVPAQNRWVAVGLALAVLGVPSVRNIIIQFVLSVTDN